MDEEPVTRADFGLPEDAFVFCSFNNSYKINAAMFDVWMRLLQSVPGSVLWLLGSNDICRENLRREAANRGVESDRLVFAGRLPIAKHLARQRLSRPFSRCASLQRAHHGQRRALGRVAGVDVHRRDIFRTCRSQSADGDGFAGADHA